MFQNNWSNDWQMVPTCDHRQVISCISIAVISEEQYLRQLPSSNPIRWAKFCENDDFIIINDSFSANNRKKLMV